MVCARVLGPDGAADGFAGCGALRRRGAGHHDGLVVARVECSHIGGDRFAATMLLFPHGINYGWADTVDAQQMVGEFRAGRVVLPGLRGSAFRFLEQAEAVTRTGRIARLACFPAALVWPWRHRQAGLPLGQADSIRLPQVPQARRPSGDILVAAIGTTGGVRPPGPQSRGCDHWGRPRVETVTASAFRPRTSSRLPWIFVCPDPVRGERIRSQNGSGRAVSTAPGVRAFLQRAPAASGHRERPPAPATARAAGGA